MSTDPLSTGRSAEAADIDTQRRSWNAWNAEFRDEGMRLPPANRRQAETVLRWMQEANLGNSSIVEIGCGSGWFSEELRRFGTVTGIDLSDAVLARSRVRFPQVTFLDGDFMQMDLPAGAADVAVTLEVLPHVVDQSGFMARIARMLRKDGLLMLATQNRFVHERMPLVGANTGRIRRWVNAAELKALLRPHFEIIRLTSLHPAGHKGILRPVNSTKLEMLMRASGLGPAWTSLRERWLLGHTLMVLARKSDARHQRES